MLNRAVMGLFRSKIEVKSSKSFCRGNFLFGPFNALFYVWTMRQCLKNVPAKFQSRPTFLVGFFFQKSDGRRRSKEDVWNSNCLFTLSDAYTTRQALSFVRSTKFDHPLTAHNAPPELKHTPHLLFHELANQLAQKAQHFLAPYCGMSFLAISALFLLYIHFGKSLWFTWIPCNEASACRVSIIKQTKQNNFLPRFMKWVQLLNLPRCYHGVPYKRSRRCMQHVHVQWVRTPRAFCSCRSIVVLELRTFVPDHAVAIRLFF